MYSLCGGDGYKLVMDLFPFGLHCLCCVAVDPRRDVACKLDRVFPFLFLSFLLHALVLVVSLEEGEEGREENRLVAISRLSKASVLYVRPLSL